MYAVLHECFIKIEKDFFNQLMEKDFGLNTWCCRVGEFSTVCKFAKCLANFVFWRFCLFRIKAIYLTSNVQGCALLYFKV